jgi:transposase
MASRHGTEFRREAVRLALTSGLTRKQIAADLGIGFSTLSKWVQQDRDKDLMAGNNAVLFRRIITIFGQ